MLDIKYIKENPEEVIDLLARKGKDARETIERILELDNQRRALVSETDNLKAKQNAVSKQIPAMKKAGQDTAPVFAEMNVLKETIKENDGKISVVEAEYKDLMLGLPNLPDADLLPGGKENNEPLRYIGEKHSFDFEPKHHVDLCTDLGLIDYERGVKLAGGGNWMYTGMGARLEWALLNYFIDTHTADGYDFILPPHMLEYQCGLTAGQFPKFADEVFKISNHPTEGGTFYMLPTAEAALASIYRDEILTEADLPKKMFAYTPCFRREAGSAGRENKGMIRVHQFDKVELVEICRPEEGFAELEKLTGHAESILQKLGLHYRVIELCTGDVGFSSAKTYDIEVWAPGQGKYLEVSSCSCFTDYQARRLNCRFKDADGKTKLCHTLNGSGVALPRLMVAMLEQHQNADYEHWYKQHCHQQPAARIMNCSCRKKQQMASVIVSLILCL